MHATLLLSLYSLDPAAEAAASPTAAQRPTCGFWRSTANSWALGMVADRKAKRAGLGGQHNGLLPHHSTLCVPQVVDLVKHQELGLQAATVELYE